MKNNVIIPIWGEYIPYNSPKSKLSDMELYQTKDGWDALGQLGPYLAGKKVYSAKKYYDTMSYTAEIKSGIASDTYQDSPHLIPYLTQGSDRVVLVVPGGGFAYKQSDLDAAPSGEGALTAMRLNEAGINAFVLWYRTNPYRFPVCLLDMQRAVRFIRYHAKDYSYDPEKIGCVGFSAGGYLCASQASSYMRERLVNRDGYQMDEIDRISDHVNLAGLIYPCVRFQSNINMLHATLGDDIWNEEKRVQFVGEYDLAAGIRSGDPPQFISYGTKDSIIRDDDIKAYRRALNEKNVEYVYQSVEEANHGYAGMQEYSNWMGGFGNWANKIFDRQMF